MRPGSSVTSSTSKSNLLSHLLLQYWRTRETQYVVTVTMQMMQSTTATTTKAKGSSSSRKKTRLVTTQKGNRNSRFFVRSVAAVVLILLVGDECVDANGFPQSAGCFANGFLTFVRSRDRRLLVAPRRQHSPEMLPPNPSYSTIGDMELCWNACKFSWILEYS